MEILLSFNAFVIMIDISTYILKFILIKSLVIVHNIYKSMFILMASRL